jgi:hypothetical protein
VEDGRVPQTTCVTCHAIELVGPELTAVLDFHAIRPVSATEPAGDHRVSHHPSEESEMALVRKVHDQSGIWIGTVNADGDVYDHSGVRIGTARSTGDIYDHSGIRIGREVTPQTLHGPS